MSKAMPASILQRFTVEKVLARSIHPKTGETVQRMTYKVWTNVGCSRRKADAIAQSLNRFLKGEGSK